MKPGAGFWPLAEGGGVFHMWELSVYRVPNNRPSTAEGWFDLILTTALWGEVLLVPLFHRWRIWDSESFTHFTWGSTGSKWQSRDSNPGRQAQELAPQPLSSPDLKLIELPLILLPRKSSFSVKTYSRAYYGQNWILLCVLAGSFFFC